MSENVFGSLGSVKWPIKLKTKHTNSRTIILIKRHLKAY